MNEKYRNEKYVYAVLSKSPTILSRAIHGIKGDGYTHAALSLDRHLDFMFSFGRRRAYNPFIGCFKRESMNEGIYKNIAVLPGAVLEIPVTREQYDAVCRHVGKFLLDAHTYSYNYFGLMGNLIGVARKDNKRFFCSEFVYHILHESGVCDLGIPRGMVRPQTLLHLRGRVIFEGDLKTYGAGRAPAALPGGKNPALNFARLLFQST
jgi:hypothetical protein